jgi:hypothetical protein
MNDFTHQGFQYRYESLMALGVARMLKLWRERRSGRSWQESQRVRAALRSGRSWLLLPPSALWNRERQDVGVRSCHSPSRGSPGQLALCELIDRLCQCWHPYGRAWISRILMPSQARAPWQEDGARRLPNRFYSRGPLRQTQAQGKCSLATSRQGRKAASCCKPMSPMPVPKCTPLKVIYFCLSACSTPLPATAGSANAQQPPELLALRAGARCALLTLLRAWLCAWLCVSGAASAHHFLGCPHEQRAVPSTQTNRPTHV